MLYKLFFKLLIFSSLCGVAQLPFLRTDTIKVFKNSSQLSNPWVGGHNFVQLSDIDIDQDGIKDLFLFDRTGNKVSTYINTGTPNSITYVHKPEFEKKFPVMQNWAMLHDYNGDGKEDIFHYNGAGFAVHKNVSTTANGLQFQLITWLVYSEFSPNNWVNLYVSPVDIPGLADIDNDGDMDVVTFSLNGISVEYHKNLAVELSLGADSLHFQYITGNWGEFTENPSNCGINLMRQNPNLPEPQHAGSCLLCLDMNDDAAQELVLGDISCCSMAILNNGGDSSYADFTSFDAFFPSNSLSIDLSIFPCGFHLDINNDGKRDLIAAASAQNVSEDNRSIWLYENTGTDQLPIFNFVKKDFLQSDMIDVGEGAYPVLIDYDADGLTDLLVSNHFMRGQNGICNTTIYPRIAAYKNTGTATSPQFTHQTDNWNNLDAQFVGLMSLKPTFGDLDNDGDLDMMTGDDNGHVHYFPNNAGAGNPITFGTPIFDYMDDNFAMIDVGNNSTPQLIDLDLDNKLDLVLGEKGGNLNYYRNIGSVTAPSFEFITDTLGDVDVTPSSAFQGYSAPFIYLDSGQYEMLMGSEKGVVYHYQNITGNISGTWVLSDSIGGRPNEVYEGIRTVPFGKDVNGNNLMDLLIGNFRGGCGFYLGDLTVGTEEENPRSGFAMYPNPAGNELTLHLNAGSGSAELSIFSLAGNLCHRQMIQAGNNSIALKEFSSGLYIVTVIGEFGVSNKKLIIASRR